MTSLIASVLVVLAMSAMRVSASGDTELTTDFFVPPQHLNASTLDAGYFAFTVLQQGVTAPAAGKVGITKVFSNVFPVLTGLGISVARLHFTPHSINVPHIHPRGTELLYVINGTLHVGLVDTNNKLFEKSLVAGDLFVFPQGLVHYQVNMDTCNTTALSAFSSSNPGLVSIPDTLFGSSIPKAVLEKAFAVNADIITHLELPFHKA